MFDSGSQTHDMMKKSGHNTATHSTVYSLTASVLSVSLTVSDRFAAPLHRELGRNAGQVVYYFLSKMAHTERERERERERKRKSRSVSQSVRPSVRLSVSAPARQPASQSVSHSTNAKNE